MIAEYGTREFSYADQGTRFTSEDFIGVLKRRDIAIRVDVSAPDTQIGVENRRISMQRFTSLVDIADHEDHDPALA